MIKILSTWLLNDLLVLYETITGRRVVFEGNVSILSSLYVKYIVIQLISYFGSLETNF